MIYKEKQLLDKIPLIGLGIANDTRGGDACGIIVDNKVEIGLDKQKLFNNFFRTSTLMKDTTTCKFVLGHDRKASVGGLSPEAAQPICIYEDGKLMFALTHNGTLKNEKELAKKYIPDINIAGKSDSWIMARIFYYCGYDVLEEYKGAGMWITVDYRKDEPVIRMFKGKSKETTAIKDPVEERPLYLTQEKNAIWYSSMYDSLQAFRFGNEIKILGCNNLYRISSDCKLVLEKVYDRSTVVAEEPWWEATRSNKARTYGYDDNDYSDYNYSSRTFYTATAPGEIDTPPVAIATRVTYGKTGLYSKGNDCVSGELTLNQWGYHSAIVGKTDLKVAFINGRLLYSTDIYPLIMDVCKDLGFSLDQFCILYPEIIDYFSYLPFLAKDTDNKSRFYIQKDFDTEEIYTGEIYPLFAYETSYKIENGLITMRESWGGKSAVTEFKESVDRWKEVTKDVDLKQLILTYINSVSKNANK